MEDFRAALYARYVSSFKSKIASYHQSEIEKHWRWSDVKYLPLLRRYASDCRILELGCGPGFFLQYLQKRGYTNAEGVDLSAEQTAIAVRNGMNAQAGDVFESLKNLHGKYDIIIAFDLLEHFTKDELLILSKLVFSALRPGGMFLIHTPNADGFLPGRSLYGDLTHVTLLNQNSLVQLFSFAGFDRYEFQEAGAAPVNLKGAFRFISWKILRFFINAMKTIEFGEGYPILTHNIIAAAYKT